MQVLLLTQQASVEWTIASEGIIACHLKQTKSTPVEGPPMPTAEFEWSTQPEAAGLIDELLAGFVANNSFALRLKERLLNETGTRLLDWVALIGLPPEDNLANRLAKAGFTARASGTWSHPGGLFPDVAFRSRGEHRLFLRVESVSDFVLSQGHTANVKIEGSPHARVRRACLAEERGHEPWVLERHGTKQITSEDTPPAELASLLHHQESFRLRPRTFEDTAAGFEHARKLVRAAKAVLDTDRTCDLFFAAEREYWQMRNRAARVQKARQDALGLGWANHDHHTYRSSREHFAPLIGVLEELGFQCRERFYAGKEAGWGAQVLEQPNAGVVIFADVDLSPEEVTGDFAHEPLKPRDELGTVGLWCQLHGEAFLQAGMHHLECQFDFDAARSQLKELGIESMKPFTDFPYLRQAFTKGEVWPLAEARIASLVKAGRLNSEQAEKFRTQGALGSHLEILQRDFGYKGFNQTGINEIILKTDPRHAHR